MKSPKYQIGDIVYVKSRYDGWVKRTIRDIYTSQWGYVLDKPVRCGKQWVIGVDSNSEAIDEQSGYVAEMAPEDCLKSLGDDIEITPELMEKLVTEN